MKGFRYSVVLLVAVHLAALALPSCRRGALPLGCGGVADTALLSALPGADMTIWSLYRDRRDDDRSAAMEYARIFLRGVDSSAVHPAVAAVADSLAEWCEEKIFRYSEAIRLRERSLRIYEALGCPDRVAATRYRLASLNCRKGFYDRTLRYATEALEYFEAEADTAQMLECYNLLGIVHEYCRDHDRASLYFRKYAAGARETGDSLGLLMALNNAAVWENNDARDTLKARRLIGESIRLCRELTDTTYLFSMYMNLVNSYLSTYQPNEAASLLAQIEPLARDVRQKGLYWYQRGGYHFYRGEYAQSVEALDKAIGYFRQGEFERNVMGCLSVLHAAYSRLGRYDKAYAAMVDYYALDDARSREDVYLKLFKTQNEMILHRQQAEWTRRRNRVLFAGTAAAFVVVVALLLFYLRYRRHRYEVDRREHELRTQRELMEVKRMQHYQTERLVATVIERLGKLNLRVREQGLRREIAAICNDLRSANDEPLWRDVETFAPEFGSDNFARLLRDYPNLTVNERRLCALLNKNLTTKEISMITKQSVHSITIARSRLRGKFGLTNSPISLYEFLSRYN